MFSRNDLLTCLTGPAEHRPIPRICRYDPSGFSSPAVEEDIEIHCFAIAPDVPLPAYWQASVRNCSLIADAYRDRFAAGALCRPITLTEYGQITSQHMASLKKPWTARPQAGFRSALAMYEDWNLAALMARYGDSITVFYWQTTA